MKKTIYKILIAALFFGQSRILSAQDDTSKLTINQQAPPLKVEEWLKGNPVNKFEKDHVYIIELGFINCPPCRAAIPNLTELARKYAGQVSVISVFVYENNKDVPGKVYIDKVRKYVDNLGDKIGYTVAVDDEKQTVARTWYEPASRQQMLGFPSIFILNQNAEIVWIGTPSLLDKIVPKIIEKSFDPIAGKEMQKKFSEVHKKINQARKRKDIKTAVYLWDSLISISPNDKFLYKNKFELLLENDMEAALTYGKELLRNQCHNYESVLFKMADNISSFDYIKEYRENRELTNLAIDLCERALVLSMTEGSNSSNILRVQARAFFMNGLYEKAIQKQELAISILDQGIQPDPEQVKRTRGGMLDVLNTYRKALSEKKGN